MSKRPRGSESEGESLSSSSSDDYSEKDDDIYENDGFVVPDDQVDEPGSDHDEKSKKRSDGSRPVKRSKPDPEDREIAGISQATLRAGTVADLEEQLFRDDGRTALLPASAPPRSEDMNESDKDRAFYEQDEELPSAASYGLGVYVPIEAEAPKAIFEPADVICRFGLPEDDLVRATDLPERLQKRLKGRMNPSEEELELEAKWLQLRLATNKGAYDLQEVQAKIRYFLQFYRVDKYETSYIQTYKFNLLSPELTDEDMWELTRLDQEWGYIYDHKQKIKEMLQEALQNTLLFEQGTALSPGKKVFLHPISSIAQDVMDLLDKTSDQNYYFELDDLENFLTIYLTSIDIKGQNKRITAKNHILLDGRKFRLHEFAEKSALSLTQLSENIEHNAKLYSVPRNTIKPQEMAFDYLCNELSEETAVLIALKNYIKAELTAQPIFRSFVRSKYAYYVRVYTSPTEKGKADLDIFHPFYRTKSLGRLSPAEGEERKEGKDVDSFGKTDLWLEVCKCEAEGLIRVDFVMPWSDTSEDKILNELKLFYLSGESVEEIETEWNEFRGEVLHQALQDLYTAFESEYRRYLTMKSEENVLQKCREAYRSRLMASPYLVRDEEIISPKVFSLVTDPVAPKFGHIALAVLDRNGQIIDSTQLTALLKWEKEILQPADQERHNNDIKTFQRMLLTYRPEVVILSSNCMQCVLMRKMVATICKLMTKEGYEKEKVEWNVDPSALLERMPDVVMGNTEVPRLFAESHRGKKMLSDSSSLLRQAVSMGRQLQNPPAEILGLWLDPSENLTSKLDLHILQKLVPEKQLLDSLEEAAVRVCAHIGADLNRMLDNPHLRAPLSFIPGLGLVKAHYLFENLMRVGHIPVRMELIHNRFLDPRVYENCIGFVKVQGTDRSDPLDRTRIHPSHYEIAQTIAASALDSKDETDERNIERVMKNPERLDKVNLDLDDYANYLATKGRAKMKDVIEMVAREMKQPFNVDWQVYEDMNPLTVLYLSSGMTEYTLRRGVIVQAKVTSIMTDKPVRCKLECELDATAKFLPEDVKEGQTIRGRVIKVIAECKSPDNLFFQVQLSSSQEDLENHMNYKEDILKLTELDPAFVETPSDWKEVAYVEEEVKNGQKYIPRLINHPKFRNIGRETALAELAKKDIGDCVFRPSSRGPDHITCTFKFYHNVCCHLDIVEDGKPADSMLGSRFHIGDEIYESLQEIIERYVVPVATLTKDAINHKKFLDTTESGLELLEGTVRAEKQAAPSTIPYYYAVLPNYPQYIVLCYIPRKTLIKEYIKVKPKGLFFHEKFHANLSNLTVWFKRHYSEHEYQSFVSKVSSHPPKVITDNLYAIPGKKAERPMTPHRGEDRRYESTGRVSPAYSSRDEGAVRHTPRRDIEQDDPWRTPASQAEPAWKPWGTPREDDYVPKPSKPVEDSEGDSGDRRRGAGRGGRGRGGRCYICQEEGHISRNCPKGNKEMQCYNCQKTGHMAKDCPEENKARSRGGRKEREETKEEQGESWASGWEPKASQGWGPSDKMHVDEDKWA